MSETPRDSTNEPVEPAQRRHPFLLAADALRAFRVAWDESWVRHRDRGYGNRRARRR